jgi:hypothetical protein
MSDEDDVDHGNEESASLLDEPAERLGEGIDDLADLLRLCRKESQHVERLLDEKLAKEGNTFIRFRQATDYSRRLREIFLYS